MSYLSFKAVVSTKEACNVNKNNCFLKSSPLSFSISNSPLINCSSFEICHFFSYFFSFISKKFMLFIWKFIRYFTVNVFLDWHFVFIMIFFCTPFFYQCSMHIFVLTYFLSWYFCIRDNFSWFPPDVFAPIMIFAFFNIYVNSFVLFICR